MSIWTMAIDESGKFEGTAVAGEKREAHVQLVGGVLLPGGAERVGKALAEVMAQARQKAPGGDLHSTELKDKAARQAVRDLFAAEVARLGGFWLVVVAPPDRSDKDLARYVRMLSAAGELGARLASREGATALELRVASRTLADLDTALVGPAARKGANWTYEGKPLVEGDLRQMLEDLEGEDARAPGPTPDGVLGAFPKRGEIRVEAAGKAKSHPGLVLADFLCNYVYGRLGVGRAPIGLEALAKGFSAHLDPERFHVLRFGALGALREVDRALRERPANLARAAAAVVRPPAGNAADGFEAADESLGRTTRRLWDTALPVVSKGDAEAVAAGLAAHAEAELSAKHGRYEGTWLALRDGWAGEGEMAARVRDAVRDRELTGRLWRLTLECANHRGDTASAHLAADRFDALLAEGRSIVLLSEELKVANLAGVLEQNRLPAPADETPALNDALRAQAARLVEAAERAGAVVDVPEDLEALALEEDPPEEAALWLALTGEPARRGAADRERGRCFGTAARSLAFVGELDAAVALALRARSHFRAPFDLDFNAQVLARIELERARRAGGAQGASAGRLRAALAAAKVPSVTQPKAARRAVAAAGGERFRLDLLLRALLWAPEAADTDAAAWTRPLAATSDSSLFATLDHMDVGHPTELVARHAGELLLRAGEADAARRWFGLSLRVARALGDGTLERMARFTERLAEGGAEVSGAPPGSLFNPVFEYR